MEELLQKIKNVCSSYIQNGKVATYIPELAKADPNEFGICTISLDYGISGVGDYKKSFTMQSIVKAIILLRALEDKGEAGVRKLVGVEATGKPFDAFNYSDQDLKSEHINPMINAGAIALCTLIDGENYRDKFQRLLDLTRKISGNPDLDIDEAVYKSEKATGNKNRALTYMLKAYGIINEDAEEVLDCYFRACSIKVTSVDLARIGLVLANGGNDPITGERIFDKKHAKYINAVLMTCGMYDGSGEFAITVGVPAKSGVGGGIMAVVPNRMGIGIYSPALDKKGNSCAGIKALELLSKELELSIF
ncbi:MAG: glutaminase A [Ruminococcaceae bacterium]|nr:glutaminase A [Oscillospiraceae bacterium]